MISSYILSDDPDMASVFGAIASDIFIVKNAAGQTYIPLLGINGIGNWNVVEGYKVKASTNTTHSIGCTQVDPTTTPINLSQGWSMMSYLRDSPMDIATALSSISSATLLVKDSNGKTYIPLLGINNIGNMISGQVQNQNG